MHRKVANALLVPAVCLQCLCAMADQQVREHEISGRPTIGLVLSGGGARGAAHVGVLKLLNELQIPIDYIAGTSMGAIVGGLYASGMTVSELERVFKHADWSFLLGDKTPRVQRSFRRKGDSDGFLVDFELGIDTSGLIFPSGLIQGQNLQMELRRLTLPVISIDDFDNLPIPFRAVATDIVSGESVVLRSGDLATALRASMSAPGLFRSVRQDGRLLVDGGITNNLPVQVVRDMGADILIVVDVGFPLLPEEQIASAFGITLQMLTILINSQSQVQSEQLLVEDVLIAPDLDDISSQDFQRMGDALERGYEKARLTADDLHKFSVPLKIYQKYQQQQALKTEKLPIVDKLRVINESGLSPKIIKNLLADPTEKLLNADQLELDITDIYGFDTFEIVSYDVVRELGESILEVRTTEKSWGPTYLRFGVNLEDDFDGQSNFNLASRLTHTEINGKGGELRADVQIGETPRLFMELYQPLDFGARWFVNPQVEFQQSNSGLFVDGNQISEFRSSERRFSLEAGRQFGNWGEFRFGLTRLHNNASLHIGVPGVEITPADFTLASASFSYDTIDRLAIPKSGTNFTLTWTGSRESLGSNLDFDLTSVFFLNAQSIGENTFLHWWNLATTLSDDTNTINPFSLGGLFNLSGYAPDELAGQDAAIGRFLYYRQPKGHVQSLFDTPLYLGASIEVGNAWTSSDDISLNNTLLAGSIFIIADTLLGPLYIAYGVAESGRRSGYLFLGQTF